LARAFCVQQQHHPFSYPNMRFLRERIQALFICPLWVWLVLLGICVSRFAHIQATPIPSCIPSPKPTTRIPSGQPTSQPSAQYDCPAGTYVVNDSCELAPAGNLMRLMTWCPHCAYVIYDDIMTAQASLLQRDHHIPQRHAHTQRQLERRLVELLQVCKCQGVNILIV
jgi:hypothetical protein